MKLGFLTVPFGHWSLEQVARWASGERLRAALEIACWPAGSGDARRYAGVTHIDVDGSTTAGRGDPGDARRSRRSRSPLWATTRTSCTRISTHRAEVERPPAQGDRGGGRSSASRRQHVRRQRQGAGRSPRTSPSFAKVWPRHRRVRRRPRRQDRDRELPDDLQLRRVAGRRQPGVLAGRSGARCSTVIPTATRSASTSTRRTSSGR